MDYEKKYKEALERAKKIGTSKMSLDPTRTIVEQIFPELAESEDEKIRKDLIHWVKTNISYERMPVGMNYSNECVIAWLEKQGERKPSWSEEDEIGYNDALFAIEKARLVAKDENDMGNLWFAEEWLKSLKGNRVAKKKIEKQDERKPANKVEPRFGVSDLVVDNSGYVWKIEGILNQFYLLEGVEGGESRLKIEQVNKDFHLWTIQDAKDGDVLVLFPPKGAERLFIFKEIKNSGVFKNAAFYPVDFHCTLVKNVFRIKSEFEYIGETNENFAPATKEQRELLFSKMKEAGYGWNKEECTLEKI